MIRPSGKNRLRDYFAMLCAKRMRIVAICAREAFGRAYDALLSTVREKHPKAVILCALGPGTPETRRLYERIRTLVESRRSAGDSRIFDMAFANTLDGEGLGSADHPSMKTHIRMAEELTGQLKAILGWNSPND